MLGGISLQEGLWKINRGVGFVFTDLYSNLIELEMQKSAETKKTTKLCWNTQKFGEREMHKEESYKILDNINMIVQDCSTVFDSFLKPQLNIFKPFCKSNNGS